MIEVTQVWEMIDRFVSALPAERIPLENALGLTLAEEVKADRDGPPFDRASVDGYAIRASDPSDSFEVIGQIAAGDFSEILLGPGQAVRIFTGAPLPSDGLRVVMQEVAERRGNTVRFTGHGEGEGNFARRGEDFHAGDPLVPAGTRIDAAVAATLAAVGATQPRVLRPTRVLHLTTGDEIVSPDVTPRAGQIRNSNALLLRGLLSAFPLGELRHVHLPDDRSAARGLVETARRSGFDLILFSGGASVGDFDFTSQHLDELGFTRHCDAVNVRPGKPLIFATRGEQVAFGMPGNPGSHFACFHVFVARALARLTGRAVPRLVEAKLGEDIPGRANARVTFWPGRLCENGAERVVVPGGWNGSGHLAALRGVDALIRLEANTALPKAGETVQILPVA